MDNEKMSYHALLMFGSSIIGSTILFIALLDMPGGYYDFLRIAICLISTYQFIIAIQAWEKGYDPRLAFRFLGMILFNPIYPFYLNRSSWRIIDITLGITFMLIAVEDILATIIKEDDKFLKLYEFSTVFLTLLIFVAMIPIFTL